MLIICFEAASDGGEDGLMESKLLRLGIAGGLGIAALTSPVDSDLFGHARHDQSFAALYAEPVEQPHDEKESYPYRSLSEQTAVAGATASTMTTMTGHEYYTGFLSRTATEPHLCELLKVS